MNENNSSRITDAIIGVIFASFAIGLALWLISGRGASWSEDHKENEKAPLEKFQEHNDNKRRPMTVLPYEIIFPED